MWTVKICTHVLNNFLIVEAVILGSWNCNIQRGEINSLYIYNIYNIAGFKIFPYHWCTRSSCSHLNVVSSILQKWAGCRITEPWLPMSSGGLQRIGALRTPRASSLQLTPPVLAGGQQAINRLLPIGTWRSRVSVTLGKNFGFLWFYLFIFSNFFIIIIFPPLGICLRSCPFQKKQNKHLCVINNKKSI